MRVNYVCKVILCIEIMCILSRKHLLLALVLSVPSGLGQRQQSLSLILDLDSKTASFR